MIKNRFKKPVLIVFIAMFCATSFCTNFAQADEENKYRQSFSIQLGLNGAAGDSKSYGFGIIPPDLSYSRELYDDDFLNISTASFYDNIGVEVKSSDRKSNFSYRIGQRIDIGLELGKYTPYVTFGLGIIKNPEHFQTSPVSGIGYLTRISERLLWVNEVNFQKVHYQNSGYQIINISTGITYGF